MSSFYGETRPKTNLGSNFGIPFTLFLSRTTQLKISGNSFFLLLLLLVKTITHVIFVDRKSINACMY